MTEKSVFEWVAELPPAKGPTWVERLRPLDERPGEWARVFEKNTYENASGVAGKITRAEFNGLEAGQYEAVARTVNGRHFVYARRIANDTIRGVVDPPLPHPQDGT